ncbi:MAG: NifU family protein [Gammaproteobacteria bacterium]
MNEGDTQALERDLVRIEEAIRSLEALSDPRGREQAKELVQVVLDLHGAGLARLLELVSAAGAAGQSILDSLAEDEQVRGLLLLHGLHPQDLESRVQRAVEKMRPFLGTHGLRLELLETGEEVVRLKVHGNWQGKSANKTLQRDIEFAILDAAPDVTRVDVEGLAEPPARAKEIFVPVPPIPRRRREGIGAGET